MQPRLYGNIIFISLQKTVRLTYGVMVALQILVLPV